MSTISGALGILIYILIIVIVIAIIIWVIGRFVGWFVLPVALGCPPVALDSSSLIPPPPF